MASLHNYQKLVQLEKHDDRVMLANHTTSLSIVVTHQERRVVVYNIVDQKTVKSWSSKLGQEISGAIYNEASGEYAAVFTDKVVRSWTENDQNMEKGRKTKLEKPAWGLHCGPKGQSLVLFKDGSLRWLDEKTCTEGTAPVVHSLSTVHKSMLYVAVFTQDQLLVYKFGASKRVPHTAKYELPSAIEATKSTVCFHKYGDTVVVLALARDGRLLSLNVSEESSEWQKLECPSVNSSCLASLGSNFIALPGMNSENQDGILIWDLKYNMSRFFRPYPDGHTSCQQLFTAGDRLVIVCSGDIYVCRYSIESTSLAAAMGQLQPSKTQKRFGNAKFRGLKLLLNRFDEIKTLEKESLGMMLKDLALRLEKPPPSALILSLRSQVCQVLSMCATDDLWLPESVIPVVQAYPLPARQCTRVFEQAIKTNELQCLHTCLQNMDNVPENLLVKSLACYLRNDANSFPDIEYIPPVEDSSDTTVKCPFSPNKAAYITAALKMPYTDIFLQDAIRDIEFSLVLSLLQYLFYLLTTASLLSVQDKNDLDIMKVTEWLNIVTDAHFSQLVLSTDAHPLLVELHQTVEAQVELMAEIVSLDCLLTQIKDKCNLPSEQSPGTYNIHTLHIL